MAPPNAGSDEEGEIHAVPEPERQDRHRARDDDRDRKRRRDDSRDRGRDDRDSRRPRDSGRERSRDRDHHRDRDRNRDMDHRAGRDRRDGRDRDRMGGGAHMDRLDRDRDHRDRERDGKRRAEREREDKTRAEREKAEKERQVKIAAEEEEAYRARVEAALKDAAPGLLESEEDEEDEEQREKRLAEERRKRREAIVAKHKNGAPAENGASAENGAPAEKDAPVPAQLSVPEQPSVPAQPSVAPAPTEAASLDDAPDMFADDVFDDEAEERAAARVDRTADAGQTGAADMTAGLSDNWDDAEGYYRARMGEVLDGRYQVMESHGRGVFSTVVKAKDLQSVVPINTDANPQTQNQNVGAGEYSEVALKVIRANETMYKAAQLEITVCKKLMDADPENKRHCVGFLRSFEFRDHVFMVFESMHMNLREVIKKYGRDVGLNVHGVRSFATQMLISLRHLKNCGVVHADIKPDNILVNGSHNVIKICDFGSAMFDGDNEITPYLQSRFYRAPEVILGLPYSHPMDLWSIGCCLYELYMGKIAFQGRSNNEMMKKFIEAKGPVPRKLLRRAVFRDNHYNHEGVFSVVEDDPVTRQAIRRLIRDAKPVKELSAVLAAHDKNLGEAERRKVSQLADLLDKIFTFDPEKRITVTNALTHPFIKEGIAAPLP